MGKLPAGYGQTGSAAYRKLQVLFCFLNSKTTKTYRLLKTDLFWSHG